MTSQIAGVKTKNGKEATLETYRRNALLNSPAVEELIEFALAERDPETTSFEETEQGFRERLAALECELLATELKRYDVDETVTRVEANGVEYRRKLESTQTYLCQSGEIHVERSLFVPCSGGGRSICPLELRAGIIGGFWTPRAAKVGVMAVANMTPRECSELFAEQGGMNPSTSSLDRLPKTVSQKWESRRLHFEAALREEETVPYEATVLAVSIDGVQAPMKDEGRAEKRSQPNKRPMGPAGYKEVGCATVSLMDREGNRIETRRYGRMPQSGKVDVKNWVISEARSLLQQSPNLDVVFLADGAPDLWRFADRLEAEIEIDIHRCVDVYHVLERLKLALDAYHGDGSAKARGAFEELRLRLTEEEDGVDAVLRALRYRRGRSTGSVRKAIDQQIGYFETLKDKMPYALLRDLDLPIGSGVVEAACKTLVTQRMKRSGMSWLHDGGQAVLTCRALMQSQRWRAAWKHLAAEFTTVVRCAA